MKKQHKFSIWYALVGIWLLLIMHNVLISFFGVRSIPYSEFLSLVKENRVSEVAISDNMIQGKMVAEESASGKEQLFRTVRVDPSISELLNDKNVKFTGRIESNFFGNLLSWLIPMALLIGFWLFMMNRMQRQQTGFMSFGKNKAKVYMDDEVEIRFDDAAGVDEAKQELEEVINFLKEPERFTKIGGQIPRGILLGDPRERAKPSWPKRSPGRAAFPFSA